jgi:hypothetical protein
MHATGSHEGQATEENPRVSSPQSSSPWGSSTCERVRARARLFELGLARPTDPSAFLLRWGRYGQGMFAYRARGKRRSCLQARCDECCLANRTEHLMNAVIQPIFPIPFHVALKGSRRPSLQVPLPSRGSSSARPKGAFRVGKWTRCVLDLTATGKPGAQAPVKLSSKPKRESNCHSTKSTSNPDDLVRLWNLGTRKGNPPQSQIGYHIPVVAQGDVYGRGRRRGAVGGRVSAIVPKLGELRTDSGDGNPTSSRLLRYAADGVEDHLR